ncbi:hypothetical protein HD806DRAFT_512364 [Xylariaceae sp. AK1471]|nr:hypothetical protein HD806DRAFT_512364 [Xylariaceae sp. AK1471]
MRSLWSDENKWQWRHLSDHYAPSPGLSYHPFIGSPPPLRQASVASSAQMGLLQPSAFVQPAHGLPALSMSPISAPINYEIPGQRQIGGSCQPNSTSSNGRALLSQAACVTQLQRRWELEDKAYPLKLIRQLDRTYGQSPRVSDGRAVFGVMHINNSVRHGLIVENVSTYTTVQAANDRVLDFWDREYGTGMFTDTSPIFETNTISLKFEHFEEAAVHPYGVSSQNKSEDYPSGGVPANNSHWKIDNKCLFLKHKSGEGEKKVYVVISYVRDNGIQV